jgi:hypothetical protein
MKNVLSLFITMLFFSACTVTQPATSLDDSYLIHVELVKNEGCRHSVIMALKEAHARDLREEDDGPSLIIEAAYYKADNSFETISRIATEIQWIQMVTDVQVMNNPRVVRDPR